VKCYAVALSLLCLGAGVGRACSCAQAYTVAMAYSAATDVFAGTVLSVEQDSVRLREDWIPAVKARIRIEQSWKGAPAGQVVTLHMALTTCAVELPTGEVVVLFANRATRGPLKGKLSAGLCGQPMEPLSTVGAASDSLGPPRSIRSGK